MTAVQPSEDERLEIDRAIEELGAEAWRAEGLDDLRRRIKKSRIAEQANLCCYCRQLIPTDHGRAWDLDHVLCRSLYPQFCYELENLAASCIDCNQAKRTYDALKEREERPPSKLPRRSGAYTLCHPHFDDYDKHILRVGNGIYASRSRKGTETISACKLFRYTESVAGANVDPDAVVAADLAARLSRASAPGASEESVSLALLEVQFIISRALEARYGTRPGGKI